MAYDRSIQIIVEEDTRFIPMNASSSTSPGSIPIGIEDFKKIRDLDLYYVDKTWLIEKVLSRDDTDVFIFTRPSRFGKSLNLSMLDAYLNQNHDGNDWFDGLEISKTDRFDSDKNGNVVINLNLKDLDESYELFIENMRERVGKMYGRFKDLRNSLKLDEEQKVLYLTYKREESTIEKLQSSLLNLTELLKIHYGKPVIILIDEYDDAINRATDEAERRRIIDFMSKFLSPALKGNESLRFAVITGVMQIAKEEFYSGLNHIEVCNVFSDQFDELFGFTPDEVRRICADFGRPEKFEEAREWYDGYRFGSAEIYNPWSVLKYVKSGFTADSYWVNTSGNAVIPPVLNRIDETATEVLAKALNGEDVRSDLVPTVAYSDIGDAVAEELISILVMGGYLNAVSAKGGEEGEYSISIPNKEVRDVFRKEIRRHIRGVRREGYTEFVDAALRSDVDVMRGILTRVLTSISERLLPNPDDSTGLMDRRFREANYHVMMLSILDAAIRSLDMKGCMETGDGRSTITMESGDSSRPSIVMGLKWRNGADDDLDDAAESAIEQIHEKKYCLGMEGRMILYGIAFRKRDVRIRCEEHNG